MLFCSFQLYSVIQFKLHLVFLCSNYCVIAHNEAAFYLTDLLLVNQLNSRLSINRWSGALDRHWTYKITLCGNHVFGPMLRPLQPIWRLSGPYAHDPFFDYVIRVSDPFRLHSHHRTRGAKHWGDSAARRRFIYLVGASIYSCAALRYLSHHLIYSIRVPVPVRAPI